MTDREADRVEEPDESSPLACPDFEYERQRDESPLEPVTFEYTPDRGGNW